MKQLPAQTLVTNLKMLLEKTKMPISALSTKSGVSVRMINYILTGERGASVEVAGQLAEAFGLTGWQLIMPSLPYDIARNGELEKLINQFTHCPEPSREYVLSVTERDATYHVPPTAATQ